MRIALGSDHRGLRIRSVVAECLAEELIDTDVTYFGPNDHESIDYPDVAAEIADLVSRDVFDCAILVCGSGIGMCVVANKFPGIRAAACHNDIGAELSRRHNNANILCLSGDLLGDDTCRAIMKKWLHTDFEGGRHQTRIDKIDEIESKPLKER